MQWLLSHLRNKFIAGTLAAGPIVFVIYGAVWLEQTTSLLAAPLPVHFPGLGLLLALAAIYLLGLGVTSLLGRFFLRISDHVLRRVPGLNLLYMAWKDVLVLPPGSTGIYSKVVLVPAAEDHGLQLGFSSGVAAPGVPDSWCVFIPSAPNPLGGQLVLVRQESCLLLDLSVEEAFKFLLSTGNYLPAGIKKPTMQEPTPINPALNRL